jgi:hypothetical protein
VKRRQFIIGGAAVVGLAALAWVGRKRTRPVGYEVLATPQLLRKFLGEPALVHLGDDYRRAQPAVLAGLIAGESNFKLEQEFRDADELDDLVQKNARADFVQGNLVQLEGWVLSRTEARQCALLSLLPDA